MKITCESCGAKYTIADDKVRGRKVKIRCKGCGTPIVVDGQQSAPPEGEAPAPADAEPAVSVEVPPSAPPEVEWSVNLSETEQLSLSTQQVVEAWGTGQIGPDAYVWRDGMGDWLPIQECAELAPLLSAPPAPAEAPPAESGPADPDASDAAPKRSTRKSVSPARGTTRSTGRAIQPSGAATRGAAAAARVTRGRAQGAPDLFAGVEKAGSDEEEVATSAPILPQVGSSKYEEKPTGARNENSVLFSLDAMKAGFAGPPPTKTAPERKKNSTGSTAGDPFGMGGGPLVAGLGGANTLFSLAENQALLTAPPPPDPPKPVVAAFAPGPVGSQSPPKKNPVLFGVIGVGILGVGLALGLGMSGDDKDSVGSASSASIVDKEAANTSASEKSADETEPPKKEEAEAAPTEEVKKEGPTTAQASSDSEKAEEKREDSSAKPGPVSPASKTVTKEASKQPAAVKEEPKAAAAQPFNRGAAVSALSSAASQSASCKKIGGPTGSGKVQVKFAPSGRVTSATVTGAPFAGTSVGGCVASVFRRSKVPAFSGSAITVSKSFSIR